MNSSLVYFIYSLTDVYPSSDTLTVHVSGSTGVDVRTCGWDCLPCCSISGAVSFTSRAPSILLVLTSDNHTAETQETRFDLNRAVSVGPLSSSLSATKYVSSIESESGVFITDRALVEFVSVLFMFDSAAVLRCPLFNTISGRLSLNTLFHPSQLPY